MKLIQKTAMTLILASLMLNYAVAEDKSASGSGTGSEPGVVNKVEHAVKRGADATVKGVKHGAKAAASGIQRGGKAAAHGVERGVEATGHALNRVGDKLHGSSESKPAAPAAPEK